MTVIVTDSRGIEMRYETGDSKAIDRLILELKLSIPDWRKITIEIHNEKD